MSLSELLTAELKKEAASTRKLLAVVPEGNSDWKPHERSFHIQRLATHVAEIPHWLNRPLETDEFDPTVNPAKPFTWETNEELLAFFDDRIEKALGALENVTDEKLNETWTFRRGDHVFFSGTRYMAIRNMMFNHWIHHRGQLSVYLRLLDIAIPGMYGPSADEVLKIQQTAAKA